MSDSHSVPAGLALNTRLTRTGKTPSYAGGSPVNTPLVRASTVLFDSVGAMRDARARRDEERIFSYGARGTPTTSAIPRRTGVHSTPSVRVSSPRRTAW